MSILDTFSILFTSNAKEVEKDTEAAAKAAHTLAQELNADNEAAAKLHHEVESGHDALGESFERLREHGVRAFERLIESVAEYVLAWQAVIKVERLVEDVFAQAEATDKLGEQAKQLGVNIELLDAYGNIAKRFQGTAEGFVHSIEAMERNLGKLELTGKSRALPFLNAFGLGVEASKKPVLELIPLLASAAEHMDKQVSSRNLRGLGLDDGTIRLIQSGNKEVQELLDRQGKLGLITAEDAEKAEAFNRVLDDTRQVFRSLVLDLDAALLPALTEFIDVVIEIVNYLRQHYNLVIGFFIALGAAIFYAADGMRLFNASFLLNPFVWVVIGIAAAIAAFALLYEDIQAFVAGHKSLIGDLIKIYPEWGAAIVNGVKWAFAFIRDDWAKAVVQFKGTWEELKIILNVMKLTFDAIFSTITALFTAPGTALDILYTKTKAILDYLLGVFPQIKSIIEFVAQGPLAIAKAGVGGIANLLGLGDGPATRFAHEPAPAPGPGPRVAPSDGGADIRQFYGPGQVPNGLPIPDLGDAQRNLSSLPPIPPSTSAELAGMLGGGAAKGDTNVTVTVGPTTIETQATDAEGISKVLTDHIKTATQNYATGVSF